MILKNIGGGCISSHHTSPRFKHFIPICMYHLSIHMYDTLTFKLRPHGWGGGGGVLFSFSLTPHHHHPTPLTI